MSIDKQLFEGKLINLRPIDHEKDPQVESRWTHDLTLMRSLSHKSAMPQSVVQIKKKYEAIEKKVDEAKNLFHFTIRDKQDNRYLGFIRIEGIEWTHGMGNLQMAVGDEAERNKGYGGDALQLMLRFAFNELNLYRLSAVVNDDNQPTLRFFKHHGFMEEVRRRKALLRDGQAWDVVHLGILRDEWLAINAGDENE
jgi:RimJ/RimL family protein N-acetyltransferase